MSTQPADLIGQIGTFCIHRYAWGYQLTDGALDMAETCKAYWLLDLIISHQTNPKVRRERFQHWHLKRTKGSRAVARCSDGNIPLCEQRIPFTDFPLKEMHLYLCDRTIMLASEY